MAVGAALTPPFPSYGIGGHRTPPRSQLEAVSDPYWSIARGTLATPSSACPQSHAHSQIPTNELQRLQQLRQQLLQQQQQQFGGNGCVLDNAIAACCAPGECEACDHWALRGGIDQFAVQQQARLPQREDGTDYLALQQQQELLAQRERQLRLLQQQALLEQRAVLQRQAEDLRPLRYQILGNRPSTNFCQQAENLRASHENMTANRPGTMFGQQAEQLRASHEKMSVNRSGTTFGQQAELLRAFHGTSSVNRSISNSGPSPQPMERSEAAATGASFATQAENVPRYQGQPARNSVGEIDVSLAVWRETQSLTESLGSGPATSASSSQNAPGTLLATAAAVAAAARRDARHPGGKAVSTHLQVPAAGGGGGSLTPSDRGEVSSHLGSTTPSNMPTQLSAAYQQHSGMPSYPPVLGEHIAVRGGGLMHGACLEGKEVGLPRWPSGSIYSTSSTAVPGVSAVQSSSQSEPTSLTVGGSNAASRINNFSTNLIPDTPSLSRSLTPTSFPMNPTTHPSPASGAGRVHWLQAERDALESWLSSSSTAWEVLERRTRALHEVREHHLHHLEEHAEKLQTARQVEVEQLRGEGDQRRRSREQLQAHADELAAALASAEARLQEKDQEIDRLQGKQSSTTPPRSASTSSRGKPQVRRARTFDPAVKRERSGSSPSKRSEASASPDDPSRSDVQSTKSQVLPAAALQQIAAAVESRWKQIDETSNSIHEESDAKRLQQKSQGSAKEVQSNDSIEDGYEIRSRAAKSSNAAEGRQSIAGGKARVSVNLLAVEQNVSTKPRSSVDVSSKRASKHQLSVPQKRHTTAVVRSRSSRNDGESERFALESALHDRRERSKSRPRHTVRIVSDGAAPTRSDRENQGDAISDATSSRRTSVLGSGESGSEDLAEKLQQQLTSAQLKALRGDTNEPLATRLGRPNGTSREQTSEQVVLESSHVDEGEVDLKRLELIERG